MTPILVGLLLVVGASASDLPQESCAAGSGGSGTCTDGRESSTEGLSLLSLRSSISRQASLEASKTKTYLHLAEERSVWLLKQKGLRNRVQDASHGFDKFIADSKASTDACSARIHQAGKMLDHIKNHGVALNEQIEAQQEVIKVETVNLNNTDRSIRDAIEVFESAMQDCEEERAEASQRNAQYKAELKELEQIASPSVRADVSDNVTAHAADVAAAGVDAVKANKTALLQRSYGEWSLAQCRAFVRWSQSRKISFIKSKQPANATTEESCDEKKDELQDTFTEAYKDLTEMEAEAAKEMVDKSCDEAARVEHDAALVPLNAERERATDKIEEASGAVAALRPVADLMQNRIKELDDLMDSIEKECTDSAEVTEYLEAVRELLGETAKCPGMASFTLKVPKPLFCTAGLRCITPDRDITETCGRGCCPKSCGKCGGAGCSKRPGGNKNCCVGALRTVCKDATGPPPCLYAGSALKPTYPDMIFG